MQVKLFELRDRGTFVPAMAVKMEPGDEPERWLLGRSGYRPPYDLVVMTGLAGGLDKSTCDPYDWGGNGTRLTAHLYIMENWDKLKSGDVICTETIRGERTTPKVSERLESPE